MNPKSVKSLKKLSGIVENIVDKSTLSVKIVYSSRHPKYEKLVHRTRNFLVSNNDLQLNIGDKVEIVSGKKISKNKSFSINKVI